MLKIATLFHCSTLPFTPLYVSLSIFGAPQKHVKVETARGFLLERILTPRRIAIQLIRLKTASTSVANLRHRRFNNLGVAV